MVQIATIAESMPGSLKLCYGESDLPTPAFICDAANRAMRSHVFDPSGYPTDVPVTIAWCEKDRLLGPPKPHRRPPGARFLVLRGVGHTPTWDDPELVARTLLDGSAPQRHQPGER